MQFAPGDPVRSLEDYSGADRPGHVTVRKNQLLTVVGFRDEFLVVQTADRSKEGLVPASYVTAVGGKSVILCSCIHVTKMSTGGNRGN